jgi:BON domain-containing protein
MRSPKVLGAVWLALGVSAAFWLLRNPRARSAARRALGTMRAPLRDTGISKPFRQWLPTTPAGSKLAPGLQRVPGVLSQDDQNLTITQRVRSLLGREPALASIPHFNINTEGEGVVYLRGYVHSEEQRHAAERVAGATEGVTRVVNELHIEQAVNL